MIRRPPLHLRAARTVPPKAKAHPVALLFTLLSPLASHSQELPSAASAFRGRALVAACDTDMLPFAYLGGTLGPAVGPDQLAVIRLDSPLSHDFWHLSTDAFEPERTELVKLQESVPVPRGPQSMAILRTR